MKSYLRHIWALVLFVTALPGLFALNIEYRFTGRVVEVRNLELTQSFSVQVGDLAIGHIWVNDTGLSEEERIYWGFQLGIYFPSTGHFLYTHPGLTFEHPSLADYEHRPRYFTHLIGGEIAEHDYLFCDNEFLEFYEPYLDAYFKVELSSPREFVSDAGATWVLALIAISGGLFARRLSDRRTFPKTKNSESSARPR